MSEKTFRDNPMLDGVWKELERDEELSSVTPHLTEIIRQHYPLQKRVTEQRKELDRLNKKVAAYQYLLWKIGELIIRGVV